MPILGDAKRKGSTDGEPETKRAKKPTVPENHVKVTKGKWGMKLFENDFCLWEVQKVNYNKCMDGTSNMW